MLLLRLVVQRFGRADLTVGLTDSEEPVARRINRVVSTWWCVPKKGRKAGNSDLEVRAIWYEKSSCE